MNGTRDHEHAPFAAHLAECAACRDAGDAVARVSERLAGAAAPAVDAAALSRRVLLAVGPELARRARATDWRRLAAAVLGSLLPLPLVLAMNAVFIAFWYTLLTLVGLPTVATYAVASYAAGLVFVLGATYASIPVLVERSTGAT